MDLFSITITIIINIIAVIQYSDSIFDAETRTHTHILKRSPGCCFPTRCPGPLRFEVLEAVFESVVRRVAGEICYVHLYSMYVHKHNSEISPGLKGQRVQIMRYF